MYFFKVWQKSMYNGFQKLGIEVFVVVDSRDDDDEVWPPPRSLLPEG